MYLKEENRILYVEITVRGFFAAAYCVKIDLENKKIEYHNLEDGYVIIEDKEFNIDDLTAEKFEKEINNIGVLNREHEYFTGIIVGASWSVKIRTSEGSFESNGYNDFPKGWASLYNCVENLVNREF
jgi:hypothetical protein